MAIPDAERKAAGLDRGRSSWIILDEINTENASSSFYLEPDCRMGRFSRDFITEALDLFWRHKDSPRIAVTRCPVRVVVTDGVTFVMERNLQDALQRLVRQKGGAITPGEPVPSP